MKRVVVGVDGSAASAAALRFATHVALGSNTDILAVHAYQERHTEVRPPDHRQHLSDRASLLSDVWVRSARDAGVTVETMTREDDPRNIVNIANEESTALLVLGRTGSGSGPGFLHLGSVVEHAAHHSRVPLAVIPPYVSGATNRIVVGVDGSPESEAAVHWCAAHARSMEADVVAVNVERPFPGYTPSYIDDNWRNNIECEIRRWTQSISATDAPVTAVVASDLHPADGLIGVASARHGDLLVVGTRGAGGFSGLRIGGVAMKVLHRAALSLVLAPPT